MADKIFSRVCLFPAEKRGGQKKNKPKNVFFDKNDPNLADCKIFAGHIENNFCTLDFVTTIKMIKIWFMFFKMPELT